MLGIDPTKLGGRRQVQGTAAEPVPIWPDMVDGWALFLAMDTQWQWAGAGLAGAFKAGLRYEAAEPVARSIGIELTDQGRIPASVFADLRALEGEALRYMNTRR